MSIWLTSTKLSSINRINFLQEPFHILKFLPQSTGEHLVEQLFNLLGNHRADSFSEHADTREHGWLYDKAFLAPVENKLIVS